ncbi:MAG: lipopolysaccharide heptosyltransferase II [Candidatus Omnitrophota bacterium]
MLELSKIKNILIIRTDRIGDVVLSTPTITAARKAFPKSRISVMAAPIAKELVEGNPYIDEVIIYDKKKGFLSDMDFISKLKKKRFDLALILHTTKRINIITYLARIPNRVGYKRGKFDLLLTKGLEYTKRFGEKHESEYSLDILRELGLNIESYPLFVPIDKKKQDEIMGLLYKNGLKEGKGFIVIHPGASSRSKMWPLEYFAALSDKMIEKFSSEIVIISSEDQADIGSRVKSLMKHTSISLCGKTSVGDLAPLFKKALLMVSNDSGPVHIASSIGCPVISIFSRNEPGLDPARWRPLSEKSSVFHKDAGCPVCLAHNCKKDFLCLRSVTVEEVLSKVEELFK